MPEILSPVTVPAPASDNEPVRKSDLNSFSGRRGSKAISANNSFLEWVVTTPDGGYVIGIGNNHPEFPADYSGLMLCDIASFGTTSSTYKIVTITNRTTAKSIQRICSKTAWQSGWREIASLADIPAPPMPQVQRVTTGLNIDANLVGFIGMRHSRAACLPVRIFLDKPMDREHCFVQLWRYSKRGNHNAPNIGSPQCAALKHAFRPIYLDEPAFRPLIKPIPVGATYIDIATPLQMYRPKKLRGTSHTFKNDNLYIGKMNQYNNRFANRVLYKFSVSQFYREPGATRNTYVRGNPSTDTLEIMWYVENHMDFSAGTNLHNVENGRRLIARLKDAGGN